MTRKQIGIKRRSKTYYQRNRDKIRAKTSAYRKARPEEVKARNSIYWASERGRLKRFAFQLKKYGITPSEYVSLVSLQGGKCAVCRKPNAFKKRFHIDHDHKTGRVRGLLCESCNFAIGLLRDDPELLYWAAVYLTPGFFIQK